MRRYLAVSLALGLAGAVAAHAELQVVVDGKPQVVVVTAEQPSAVAGYAAQELVYHLEKATGVKLETVTENAIPKQPAGRIYVGECDAADAAGIRVAELPGEGCALKTVGHALFIVGEDGDGDPLSMDTHAGTLWGVYELLERVLGVRWLWPGELGVYVPKTDAVTVADLDEVIQPRLLQRNLRSGLGLRGASGFTPEGKKKYAHDQAVFLRRHRMGRVLKLHYGHAFNAWWQRYGDEHPDWFQLVNGRRGPTSAGARFSMCVSNPGFHNQIVGLWLEQREKNPGEFLNINCCENDIRGLCTCERCLAWDGPQPESIPPRFGPRVVSDRYARFWLAVQQLAARFDPEATVVGYAYVNYAPPPSADIKLNEHIFVGTVPDVFFPRTDEEQQWVKDQWAGWRHTGCRLFLRPNYMLNGYCMPLVFAHQFADEFQFEAQNGMVATDFDSLTGQWAVQGTTLYLLMRLHNRPDSPADELLDEYYSAFGPAAERIRAYFDYWENYTGDNRERFREIAQRRAAGWSSYARGAHEYFPASSFEAAEKLLDQASAAVGEGTEYAARVDFLRKGLEHARLTSQVCQVLAGSDDDTSPLAWRKAVDKLMAFRRGTEPDDISNLDFCDFIEKRSWQTPDVYTGQPVRAVADKPQELDEGLFAPLRGTATCVALLRAGESFRARLACSRVGKNEAATEWRLWGPDDRLLAKGSVPVGEQADLDVPARQDGVHLLLIVSNANRASLTLLNEHAAIAGQSLKLIGVSTPLFFFVPEGTEEFALTVTSPAPGETARARILGPEGEQIAMAATGEQKTVSLEVTVPRGQAGKAWSVQIEKGDTGVLEDYTLTLDESIPGYWSHAGDRLVTPVE